MFRLTSKIVIHNNSGNKLTFKHVNSIQVNTSIDTLTDTCTIKFPRIWGHGDKNEFNLNKLIQRNNKVNVQLGYDDRFETVFTGYVKDITTRSPIIIECENEAWNLKQIKLQAKYYPELKLESLVNEYLKGYTVSVKDFDLGETRINGGMTLARLFNHLISNYPLKLYFKNGIFYASKLSDLTDGQDIKTIKLKDGTNFIEDNLVYSSADNINVQIVASTFSKNNKKIEVKIPQEVEEAEVKSYRFPGAKNKALLESYAKDIYNMVKANKMKGEITAFGEPFVQKGDFVHIVDEKNEERNNKKFLVEGVRYSFDKNGYRQFITLGKEVK